MIPISEAFAIKGPPVGRRRFARWQAMARGLAPVATSAAVFVTLTGLSAVPRYTATSVSAPSAAWIGACMAGAGFIASSNNSTPVTPGSAAVTAAARSAHAVLAGAPATVEYADVSQVGGNADQSIVQQDLAGPVWLVGFSGLRIAEGADGIPAPRLTVRARTITGMVVVVNAALADNLVIHCDT